MKFTDLFVKRPVLAIVVNLVILIAGLQSIRSLSVRQYPRSDIAVVKVSTVYVGAAALEPISAMGPAVRDDIPARKPFGAGRALALHSIPRRYGGALRPRKRPARVDEPRRPEGP